MRRIYSHARVGLMTFTLGLAIVWVANVFAIADRGVVVEIPIAVSDDVLFVFPIESENIFQWPRGRPDTGFGYFCVNHLPPAERRKWIAEYEAQERLQKTTHAARPLEPR